MEDLVFRTNELADWLLQTYADYEIDSDHLVVVGYSNGATVASSLLLLRSEVLTAIIGLRPSVPYVPEPLPNLRGKHALYIPGEQDTVVTPSQATQVAKIVSEAGGATTVAPVNSGHGLTPSDVVIAQQWLPTVI